MEFVDYKCLESLLIEGEELIATEGLGKVLGSLIKGVFSLIMRAFRTIAGIFRNIAAKLKSKKPVNNSSNSKDDDNPIEEKKENDSISKNNTPASQKISANFLDRVIRGGNNVTLVLINLTDACDTISISISENNDYKNAVNTIHENIDKLEEKYNNFEDTLNKFKDFFDSIGNRISFKYRNTYIEKCTQMSTQYTEYATRCENKLNHLMELDDEEFEHPYIEKNGIDIQKHRSPAQMALSKMSSCTSKMAKLYIEFNNMLSNAVIVYD